MASQPHPDNAPQPMAPVEVVSSRPATKPRRSSSLAVVVVVILLFALGGSLLLNFGLLLGGGFDSDTEVREEFYSHSRIGSQKVAIISVEGVMLEDEGFVKDQIDRAKKDEDVKAVVLRVNSPGGAVSVADYYYHHLRKLREESEIPIVVSMGGVAASGGYYVSMAVGDTPEAIFAEPTTWTGSIGVIIPHYNVAGLMEEWGIEDDSVVSHPLKDSLSFTRPMNPEERQLVQGLVDDAFGRFKEIIRYGRPRFQEEPEALDKVATGQIFTATQAQEAGLVDRIGFLEDAVDRAIELAGLDPDDVRVVKYEREPSLADVLFGAQARRGQLGLGRGVDLAQLLDLTSPRAYYLCSWMPSVVEPMLGRQ